MVQKFSRREKKDSYLEELSDDSQVDKENIYSNLKLSNYKINISVSLCWYIMST